MKSAPKIGHCVYILTSPGRSNDKGGEKSSTFRLLPLGVAALWAIYHYNNQSRSWIHVLNLVSQSLDDRFWRRFLPRSCHSSVCAPFVPGLKGHFNSTQIRNLNCTRHPLGPGHVVSPSILVVNVSSWSMLVAIMCKAIPYGLQKIFPCGH